MSFGLANGDGVEFIKLNCGNEKCALADFCNGNLRLFSAHAKCRDVKIIRHYASLRDLFFKGKTLELEIDRIGMSAIVASKIISGAVAAGSVNPPTAVH